MFPWSRPRPPLDAPDKLWVEQGLTWLVRTFGVDRPRAAPVVLPTPEFFPDPYDPVRGTDDDARVLLDRVCFYMGVRPDRMRLQVYPGAPEAEAKEGQEVVTTVRENLDDPEYLVARMVHAAAKVRLIDDGKLAPDHPDLHRIADLCAIFLGLGVLAANQLFREHSSGGLPLAPQSWNIYRTGSLSERAAGYALALFARTRGEGDGAAWAKRLRPNVRQAFRDSLTYLAKTGDTQFRPDEAAGEHVQDDEQRLAQRIAALQAPSSGARLAALWDLQRLGPKAAPAVTALVRALRDEDPCLRTAAAEALAAVGPAAEAAVPELVEAAMQEDNKQLRLQATCALAAIGQRADFVVPHLLHLLRSLKEEHPLVTIRALGALGTDAAVQALVDLLTDVNGDVAEEAALALGAIGPAARAAVPALLRMLGEGGYRPFGAAYVLGRIGRVDDAIVPALVKTLQHPVPEVREEVEIALRRIAPELFPELPTVSQIEAQEQRIRPQHTAGIMVRSSRFTVGE